MYIHRYICRSIHLYRLSSPDGASDDSKATEAMPCDERGMKAKSECVYIYLYIYVYIYMCVYLHLSIHIYIYVYYFLES